ncbi:MAG: hypothetical protein JST04_06695 [Bdellovibrionales bacterium]|nr:hypothetical protein [Bdellovibrionales bacterium]
MKFSTLLAYSIAFVCAAGSAAAQEKPRVNVIYREAKGVTRDYHKRTVYHSGADDAKIASFAKDYACLANVLEALAKMPMSDAHAGLCPGTFAHYEADVNLVLTKERVYRPDNMYGSDPVAVSARCGYDGHPRDDAGISNQIFAFSLDPATCSAMGAKTFTADLTKRIETQWDLVAASRAKEIADSKKPKKTEAELEKERQKKIADEKHARELREKRANELLKKSFGKAKGTPGAEDVAINPEKQLPALQPPMKEKDAPTLPPKTGADAG